MADEITDRNVFILGAGFSADAGAPVIRDFIDVSRELYDDPDSGLHPKEKQLFQNVFNFKKEVAQAREKFEIDLDNIEELFGLVEMSHRLNSEVADTRDATVYLIAKTLELATRRYPPTRWIGLTPHPNYKNIPLIWQNAVPRDTQRNGDYFHCEMYRHFANLLTGIYDNPQKNKFRSNAVITFNYDIVLDQALKATGILPDYGLTGTSNGRGIPLLKLHGSTNWVFCKDCRKPSVWQDGVTSLFPFRSIQCQHCGKDDPRLLLVPPSWDKNEYQDIMRPVWAKAVEELKAATRICIIGYSMPESDSFFKYLLTLGLSQNHQLYKLIVVDKLTPIHNVINRFDLGGRSGDEKTEEAHETIEQRYRRMLARIFAKKRFHFYGGGFAAFLCQEANGQLNRAETIQFG